MSISLVLEIKSQGIDVEWPEGKRFDGIRVSMTKGWRILGMESWFPLLSIFLN